MKRRPVLTTLKTLQAGALQTRSGVFVLSVVFSAGLMLATGQTLALTPMSDHQMQDVAGAGLAFAFDDFRFQMEPTSFFENIGAVPDRVAGATNAYKGDYRWIGTTISSGDGSSANASGLFGYADYIDGSGNFNPNPSSSYLSSGSMVDFTALDGATRTLSLPIAAGGAQGYAEVNNPFVLRVHSYEAVGLSSPTSTDWVQNVDHTALELVGATHSSPFRWAFWGQVDASNDSGVLLTNGTLTNQEIIVGSPTSRFKPDGSLPAGDGTGKEIGCSGAGTGVTGCGNSSYSIMGPVFRLYQSMGMGSDNQTLGMMYLHRLSGDFRFSVNQLGSVTAGSVDIPEFDGQEGMYFTHVNAYLPMGQLHYQSLVIGGTTNEDGNFTTDLTRIPNDPAAYNDFYGYPSFNTSTTGTAPTTAQLTSINYGFKRTGLSDRYYETHGYVRWGDNFPTAAEIVTELGSGNAGNISNNLVGTGVANTKGWSGTGVITGTTVNVTYHIKSYALNTNNFLNLYHAAGTLGVPPEISVGLCGTNRDKFCGDTDNATSFMTGSTQDVTRTIAVNVSTPSPVGQGTVSDLLSAGGMVFVAHSGGSWTVPQNPNLAAGTVSESINLLIFANWDVKKELTQSGTYNGWSQLQPDTTPNLTTIDNLAKTTIQNNGGASATMRINGINLGSSRVEGMLIHHLNVTTLGAAN